MIYIVMIIQENPHKEKEDRAEETKEHVSPKEHVLLWPPPS